MTKEVSISKRKKIYLMFDEFKIAAESFLSSVQTVDEFIFIDTTKEHIFDFVKICNYLLTEYDFIMHGKSHTHFRKLSTNGFDFDAIMKKRNKVTKENLKLIAVDCQLEDYNNKIFGEYKILTAKISLFQDFLSKHSLSSLVPYNIGKQQDVLQWLGKLPLTGYLVSFEGYDIYHSIASHPWKAKIKKRSFTPQPQPSAKKVKIAEVGTEGKQSSSKLSSKSAIEGNTVILLPNRSRLLSGIKVNIAETPDKEGKQSSSKPAKVGNTPIAKRIKVNVVTPFSLDNVEDCSDTPQVDEGVNLSIQKYKFSNKSHENSEQELQSLALDLFTQEQNQQTADRNVFLKILSHFVHLQCSFQDFFLLLEKLVLQVKRREEINLSNGEFFNRQSRSQQKTMKDDLQRSARKCVSSIGLKIFGFLKAFKEAGNTAAQVDLITSFWPMATLSDSDLLSFQQSLPVAVSLVYAEDTLLVQLSTEGFQKVRKVLFLAIVQPSIRMCFQRNELDACLAEIKRFVNDNCGYQLQFSKEGVTRLLTDYFNSAFISQPTREVPKALSIRTAKKKVELEKTAISNELIGDAGLESEDEKYEKSNSQPIAGSSSQPSDGTFHEVSKETENSSIQSSSYCKDSQHAEEFSILSQVSHREKETENELDSDDEFMYRMGEFNQLPEVDYFLDNHDSIDDSYVFPAEKPVIVQIQPSVDIGSGGDSSASAAVESAASASASASASDLDIRKIISDLKTLVSLEDIFENLDIFWEEDIIDIL
jgi:hypothetical protein